MADAKNPASETAEVARQTEPAPAGALVEPAEQAVARLTAELAAANDRYLRVAADFDNFRKRMARERAEIWTRSQAEVVSRLLDALDDLGRVAGVDLTQATARDILSGVGLVERKLLRELEGAGLARVGTAGEPFDPNHHEAVGTVAAQSPEEDHTVAEVLQPGYRFGGALLRPARVRVRTWTPDDA